MDALPEARLLSLLNTKRPTDGETLSVMVAGCGHARRRTTAHAMKELAPVDLPMTRLQF